MSLRTDNRKSFRLPFRNKFVFASSERVYAGNGLNLSSNGVLVSTLETLPRETVCKVLFLLDEESPPVLTEATVRRVMAATSDPEDIVGIAFQFKHSSDSVQEQIEQFCLDSRRNYELAATILSSGEPDLNSLRPLIKRMHLPAFSDLGQLRASIERVLRSIEMVEADNQGL